MGRYSVLTANAQHLKRQWSRARGRAQALGLEAFLNGICQVGKWHPMARAAYRDVDVVRNVPYTSSGLAAHRLDIYRPRVGTGPWPVVFYVHGGGFRILSKESHWMMALAFASRGYLVFNIEYRRGAYPRGLEDVSKAAAWLMREGEAQGADLDRLILAGDSAGANLITALSVLAASDDRPEPWAKAVVDAGFAPKIAMPACGLLEVSSPERLLARSAKLPAWIGTRIMAISRGYVGRGAPPGSLADPLNILESDIDFARPLPRFFISCGTRDPLLDDSRRLAAALERRAVEAELKIYPGGVHAFHALIWRPRAKACWRDHFAFLEVHA